MPLPKLVAAAVCIGVLGAQIFIASPASPNRSGWYWPFLPYPMYAKAHARTDTLVVPQLRVAECGGATAEMILPEDSLGVPLGQLLSSLTTIARVPQGESAKSAAERLSRVIEAQYPGRYCTASAWVRTVYVADDATYDLHRPMRRAAMWAVNRAGPE
jgi:hypothetical protein